MPDPCPHPDRDHHVIDVCEEVVHYPSEDYPCLCSGFAADPNDGEKCARCGHPAARHQTVRLCRPASAEYCGCRQVIR